LDAEARHLKTLHDIVSVIPRLLADECRAKEHDRVRVKEVDGDGDNHIEKATEDLLIIEDEIKAGIEHKTLSQNKSKEPDVGYCQSDGERSDSEIV
jgi:hypothetical protein